MLSQEDRRRLDEIERGLERDDPAFVVRMRSPARGHRPRWAWVCLYLLAWMLVSTLGVLIGLPAALPLAAVLVVATVLAWAVSRRRWH